MDLLILIMILSGIIFSMTMYSIIKREFGESGIWKIPSEQTMPGQMAEEQKLTGKISAEWNTIRPLRMPTHQDP